MPSNIFFGMQHLNNNLMCSIGMTTTGPDPDVHEIVEICVLPVSHMLTPHPDLILFNMKMAPQNTSQIDWKYCRFGPTEIAELAVVGLDKDMCAEYLTQWYNDMNMPFRKACIPLGHNFAIMRMFLYRWLGDTIYREVFQEDYRDTLIAAHFVNDRLDCRAEPVFFAKQSLRWVAEKLHIPVVKMGGSACGDAYETIEVYRNMLKTY